MVIPPTLSAAIKKGSEDSKQAVGKYFVYYGTHTVKKSLVERIGLALYLALCLGIGSTIILLIVAVISGGVAGRIIACVFGGVFAILVAMFLGHLTLEIFFDKKEPTGFM